MPASAARAGSVKKERGGLRRRPPCPVPDQSAGCRCRMLLVQFHAQPVAPKMLRRHQRRTRTRERVQHQTAYRAEGFHQRQKCRHRLLRRVQFIARIGHVEHVRDGLCWRYHIAFGQQVSALMFIPEKSGRGRIGLAKDDMRNPAAFQASANRSMRFQP